MNDISIIFITTGENLVRQKLERQCRSIEVLDCSLLSRDEILLSAMHNLNNMLITYRCPYILPVECYCTRPLGAYNVHPSLLPKYQGLNPWDSMIANNENHGGVTIHRLTQIPDTGGILLQKSFPLDFSKGLDYNRNIADMLAAEMIIQVIKFSKNFIIPLRK